MLVSSPRPHNTIWKNTTQKAVSQQWVQTLYSTRLVNYAITWPPHVRHTYYSNINFQIPSSQPELRKASLKMFWVWRIYLIYHLYLTSTKTTPKTFDSMHEHSGKLFVRQIILKQKKICPKYLINTQHVQYWFQFIFNDMFCAIENKVIQIVIWITDIFRSQK